MLSSDEDEWERWAREAVEAEAYSRRLAKRIREVYAAKRRRHRGAVTRRQYGLGGLLACAACGKRLIGHVGRYRHQDACEAFRAAATRKIQRDGRTVDPRVRGESYKADVYEDAIGLALGHVAVSASLKAGVVAEAVGRTGPGSPDALAQARLRRERERAALQYARDRDLTRLEATMARLDAEAAAAAERPSRLPTAAEARAYLESLPELWAKASDAGRKAIAEAVFERIDVLGARDFTFTLTAAAKARGWDAAFGPGVLRLESQGGRGKSPTPDSGDSTHEEGRSGRGERSRADTLRVKVQVVSRGLRAGARRSA